MGPNPHKTVKKSAVKRVVKAAVITGAVVGTGVALYKNRKGVQNLAVIIKDNVISPLFKKGVPFKEKVSDVFTNLKNLIKKKNTPSTTDIVVINSKNKAAGAKARNIRGLNAAPSPVPQGQAPGAPKFPFDPKLFDAAKENAKSIRIAAGSAAVGAGGATAIACLTDGSEKDDKKFSITVDGEEFKGALKDGKAYEDVECTKPLTGDIKITYGNGKMSVVSYKKGVLTKSVIFSDKDKDIPDTIKHYKSGKVAKVKQDLQRAPENDADKDGDGYVAANERYFRKGQYPTLEHTRALGSKDGSYSYDYFVDDKDTDGKIKGAPLNRMSTEMYRDKNGSTVREFYIPSDAFSFPATDKPKRLIRTSTKKLDGTKEIGFIGLNGQKLGILKIKDDDKTPLSFEILAGGILQKAIMFDDNGNVIPYTSSFGSHSFLDNKNRLCTIWPTLKEIKTGDPLVKAYETTGGYFGEEVHVPPMPDGEDEEEELTPEIKQKLKEIEPVRANIVLEVAYNEDKSIKHIACYEPNGIGSRPTFKTEFKDNKPARDYIYDDMGKVVLSPKYVLNDKKASK